MANTTRKIERTPTEIENLAARRDHAQANKQVGPSADAVPLGR